MVRHPGGHVPRRRRSRGVGKFVSTRAKAGTPLKKSTRKIARLRIRKGK